MRLCIDWFIRRPNVGDMPDKTSGITKTEAKTVVVLRCSFYTNTEQLAKIMQMLFGTERVSELTQIPPNEHDDIGLCLITLTEKFFRLRNEELDKLILEECQCIECGHKEFYLTTEWDAPKMCAKCHKMATFLAPVPEERMVEP